MEKKTKHIVERSSQRKQQPLIQKDKKAVSIEFFEKYVGIPFKHKGRDRKGIDCLGLLLMVFQDLGLDFSQEDREYLEDLKHTHELLQEGIEKYTNHISELKPLDVLLFKHGDDEGHCGIYIGKGLFLHALKPYGSIISRLSSDWMTSITRSGRIGLLYDPETGELRDDLAGGVAAAVGVVASAIATGAKAAFGFIGWKGLLGTAISGALGALTRSKPPKSGRREEVDSPVYSWEGAVTQAREGDPVPIIYGKIITKGNIIDVWTGILTAQSVEQHLMYMLVALCEGPIEGFDNQGKDIVINGTALENWDTVNDSTKKTPVTATVYAGNEDQDAINNFKYLHHRSEPGDILTHDVSSDAAAGRSALRTTVTGITADDAGNSNLVEIRFEFAIDFLFRTKSSGSIEKTNMKWTGFFRRQKWNGSSYDPIPAAGAGDEDYNNPGTGMSHFICSKYSTSGTNGLADASVNAAQWEFYSKRQSQIIVGDTLDLSLVPYSRTWPGGTGTGNILDGWTNKDYIEIYLERFSQDSSSSKNKGPLKWLSLDAVENLQFGYNLTALVAIEAFATSQLSGGIPDISFYVKGLKVRDVVDVRELGHASATLGWSDNPADCLYDLFTNERYGLGAYIDSTMMDIDSFITLRQKCNELVLGNADEKRHTMNLNIDSETDPWDLLEDLSNNFGIFIIWQDGKIRVRHDELEPASFSFDDTERADSGLDNIVEGSLSYNYISKTEQPNMIEASFLDENDFYKKKTIVVVDVNVEGLTPPEKPRKKIVELRGITREKEAIVSAKKMLRQSKASKIACKFLTGMMGAMVAAGDVIQITHSLPGWTNKKFRVHSVVISPKDGQYEITCSEYDPWIYGVIAGEDSYYVPYPTHVVSEV